MIIMMMMTIEWEFNLGPTRCSLGIGTKLA